MNKRIKIEFILHGVSMHKINLLKSSLENPKKPVVNSNTVFKIPKEIFIN